LRIRILRRITAEKSLVATHRHTHAYTATKAQCKYRHGPTEYIGSGTVADTRRARITEIRRDRHGHYCKSICKKTWHFTDNCTEF